MLFKTLLSTVALLLLRSGEVNASDADFHSYGQVTSCQDDLPTNATTSLDMSIFPNNDTLTFSFSGLATVSGNTTLIIAVEADGDEVYRAKLDPCSIGIPDLCPASGGQASFANASVHTPKTRNLMGLPSRADVKGRLSLQTYDSYGRFRSSCMQTALRSDASDGGNGTDVVEGSGSRNETTGGEDGISANGTADTGGNDTNGTTQDSGANTLQSVGYVAM